MIKNEEIKIREKTNKEREIERELGDFPSLIHETFGITIYRRPNPSVIPLLPMEMMAVGKKTIGKSIFSSSISNFDLNPLDVSYKMRYKMYKHPPTYHK